MQTSKSAQHANYSGDWGTPKPVIELAACLLEKETPDNQWVNFDLDPASDAMWNEHVNAANFYTKKDNGLEQDWTKFTTCFINPPGGKLGKESLVNLFWIKLQETIEAKRQRNLPFYFFWVGFDLQQLSTLQRHSVTPFDFHTTITNKRIKFIKEGKNQPTSANFFTFNVTPQYKALDSWGITVKRT